MDRFWSKVDIRGPDDCWPWKACTATNGGYGKFGWEGWRGRTMRAHRIAFYLTHGYWPRFACHKCDNPPCCNPKHLFDGSPKDNTYDMMKKGRGMQSIKRAEHTILRGEKHGNAKITAKDVRAMRRSKLSLDELADIYSMSRGQIWNIRTRRSWRHVA